jgi:hypothetical protein
VHGMLAGVITNPMGAVIPGARVDIANDGTGSDYRVTTTTAIILRIFDLALSEYSLAVWACFSKPPRHQHGVYADRQLPRPKRTARRL